MRYFLKLLAFWVFSLVSFSAQAVNFPDYSCNSGEIPIRYCGDDSKQVNSPDQCAQIGVTEDHPPTVDFSFELVEVLYATNSSVGYSYNKIWPSGTTQKYNDSVSLYTVCAVNPCGDLSGDSTSASVSATADQACMGNGCQVLTSDPNGGKNVSVAFFDSPDTVYTTVYYTGQTCSGVTDAESNPDIKFEVIDGIPTFTDNGVTVKLPDATSGDDGDIQTQAQALNPDKSVDVQNSTLTSGADTASSEVPKTDGHITVNNITNNNGGALGSYSMSWDNGSGETSGETGGNTGGTNDNITVNVDFPELDFGQPTGDLDLSGYTLSDRKTELETETADLKTELTEKFNIAKQQFTNLIQLNGGSGSCPSYTFNLPFYGNKTISPCDPSLSYVWDLFRGLLLFFSSFAAVSILFGRS